MSSAGWSQMGIGTCIVASPCNLFPLRRRGAWASDTSHRDAGAAACPIHSYLETVGSVGQSDGRSDLLNVRVPHTNRRFSTTLRILLPSPSQFSGHSQLGEVGRLSSSSCVHTLWLRARPLLAACAILSNVYLHALHSHAGERLLQDKPDAIFASLWAPRSDLSRASSSIHLRCSPHTPSLIIYPLSLAHERA